MSILVIDVGTSSMRATLFDSVGVVLHQCRSSYSPNFLATGHVEQDPASWSDTLIHLTQAICQWAAQHKNSIDALSLTAQRSSAIPVDASGAFLHPAIMWQDTRTTGLCEELGHLTGEIYARTGLRISPVLAAPKFSWLKRERPAIYRTAHKLLTIADYLVHVMTGLFVTDPTYGSRTLLMNLKTLQWDEELCRMFGLDEDKLCTIVPQGSIVGTISGPFSERTGLPAGTPLISAGGDQQCGALGAGVIGAGSVQITTGTGSYIIAASDRLYLDPEMKVLCSVSAVPGQYIVEASIPTTSAVWAWAGRTLYDSGCSPEEKLEKLCADASASPLGANGVLMLPHFQGRGSPHWNPNASGAFVNVNLATTRSDMVRATLEGIAAEIAENVEHVLRHVGGTPHVLSAGGLSNFDLFNQIQADMIGLVVRVPTDPEATSRGAWASAAVAIRLYKSYRDALKASPDDLGQRVFHPLAEHVAVYERLRTSRGAVYSALQDAGVDEALHATRIERSNA